MSNPFVSRKSAARPLGRRAIKRRLRPSPRQQRRIIAGLKADAAQQIRKGLEQRISEEPTPPPTD